jgi:5-methylcytosine-specific restriction endonuclease McrA
MPIRARTAARGYGADWQRLSAAVLRRDGHRCRYCGGHATTADHVVPRSKGGTDSMHNLVAACRSCNGSKGDRPQPTPPHTRRRRSTGKPRPRFSRQQLKNADGAPAFLTGETASDPAKFSRRKRVKPHG